MNIKVKKVFNRINTLTVPEQLELVEKVIHNLKIEQKSLPKLNWDDFYGIGKGIWNNIDAQEYVNKLRDDR
jgi:hypothetical protein